MSIHSFIITITINKKPLLLRFIGGPGSVGDAYEVSAVNDADFPTFYIYQKKERGGWHIDDDAPTDVRLLEEKLSGMIDAYIDGQNLMA